MPVYLWEGKNRNNQIQKGQMESISEEAVRAQLNRLRIAPTKIKKKPKDLLENVSFLQPKVKEKDIMVFARQFSTMIDAGLPIIQCMDILQSQQENATFKKMLKSIKDQVESGSTLADALKKYPKHFDNLFINMVAAGEAGGILDVILKRLAGYMEKAARLKRKVKGAMVYPAITIFVAVVVVAIILVFVIPVFQEMFADFGSTLPGPTLIVIAMSEFVKDNLHLIIGALIIFFFAFRKYYKTDKGRLTVDAMVLKLPVFGMLLRKVAVAKFTRTMGTMLASGVAILEALDIVAKTSGNRIVEKAIYSVRSGIAEGRTMADPLQASGVFPPMVCQMIAVGESTGALDAMLEKIADFYDEEVDQAVENLTAMIEPAMIIFLGVVVGGLIVSMYLPIFQMAGAIN
ncbi:type II secretion system F family protein [Desulfatitalea alkaliphila]|uniref:Type II secretion system F family protein n=1 Tax=Desulfatitalea alkaliphila TaxID=2929485 RepID=A0AA41R3N2_9BACT|nr:type II secretion system F family protein [Desulfatitalea alkaliphila]MCJ8500763.1 type II secretion system F family protein [Desulfatitalea alkaliphila]